MRLEAKTRLGVRIIRLAGCSPIHRHTISAFAKKLKNMLTDRGNGCGRKGIRGSKFRCCSRKRSGERKPLTERKRRGTAVCILRQMLPQNGLTERDSGKTPCVGARVEMFFSKYFVSVRWGAKLEAVSQDEGESVGDLRRNENAWNDECQWELDWTKDLQPVSRQHRSLPIMG